VAISVFQIEEDCMLNVAVSRTAAVVVGTFLYRERDGGIVKCILTRRRCRSEACPCVLRCCLPRAGRRTLATDGRAKITNDVFAGVHETGKVLLGKTSI